MKRKYLIKKDPAKEGQDNWIIMNTEQFLAWKKTPEGQLRYMNLGKLDACDEDDYIIFMECDEATRLQWKKESDKQRYNRILKKKSNIEILSYQAMTFEDEEINGEECLPNDDISIEDAYIKKVEVDMLYDALTSLTPEERNIIECLFLKDEPLTEREYAQRFGMPKSNVHYHQKVALEKMEKYFQSKVGQN